MLPGSNTEEFTMATFSLLRNARVFFTTNVNASTGAVNTTGFSTTNTREIQVLEGFSFSQATNTETITLNEAGSDPARGQQQFNTSLNPAEFSFSTYIRPRLNLGADVTPAVTGDNYVEDETEVLWNALVTGLQDDPSTTLVNGAESGWQRTTGASPVSTLSMGKSNKNQLVKFGMIILMDGQSYTIDNCSLNTASIDFGIDQIATVAWSGNGTLIRSGTIVASTATDPVLTGNITGTTPLTGSNSAKGKITSAPFISNKLSTCVLTKGIAGAGTTAYTLALTGGTLEINNNISYLTPANLGIVNSPITYFTGTRAVTGTLNCYLKSTASGAILADILTNASTAIQPSYQIVINIGGSGAVRVTATMSAAVLAVPTIQTDQIISTQIGFTAQGVTSGAYDLDAENELSLQFRSDVS